MSSGTLGIDKTNLVETSSCGYVSVVYDTLSAISFHKPTLFKNAFLPDTLLLKIKQIDISDYITKSANYYFISYVSSNSIVFNNVFLKINK